jgi:hypothetical protein
MKTAVRYLKASCAAVALAAAAAAAYPGDIIASFYVPGISANGPRGLAFDGSSYYFVADNRGPKQVRISKFTYDGNTASLAAAFNCPADVYWAMDLAYRPGRIYVASDLTSPTVRAKIYVLDEDTGQITNKFNGPFGTGVHVNGLTWDGSYLHASSYESPLVYRLTFNGSVVGSFRSSHAKNHGLAAVGSRLWLISGRPYFDARQYTTAGTLVTDFKFDVNDEYVGGASAGRPPLQTLFVSTYTGARYIYEVATDPRAYGGVVVEPASLGRVKALFR